MGREGEGRGGEERKCVTVQIRKSQVEGRYMSA